MSLPSLGQANVSGCRYEVCEFGVLLLGLFVVAVNSMVTVGVCQSVQFQLLDSLLSSWIPAQILSPRVLSKSTNPHVEFSSHF